ncbi:MAG: methyltransferase domain-containing protein [Candidatus Lokiarchaeota archaeon]|nr:methyltransferase domain-containing protein [Candidatus Lokiarchaeota archaeon]
MNSWSDAYDSKPPWDVGHPQFAIVELVFNNELRPGKVLDLGCGTGQNTIFLAENGFDAIGVDISPEAISLARENAKEIGVSVGFRVGDVLRLSRYFPAHSFDAIIDSGLFHILSDDDRWTYVRQIHRVLKENGRYYLLCFSEKEQSRAGPRRVSKAEIDTVFGKHFKINYIADTLFESALHVGGAKAYLVSATRLEGK